MNLNTKVQVFNNKQELVAEGRIEATTSVGAYINGKDDKSGTLFSEWFPFISNNLRIVKA